MSKRPTQTPPALPTLATGPHHNASTPAARMSGLTSTLALMLAVALAYDPAHAKGPGAHQHGVAKLEVVLDGNLLQLHLESPLDNLLGFERGPRNEAERQMVRAMAQRFHASGGLFAPTPAAVCTPFGSELASAVIEARLLALDGKVAATAPAVAPHAADKAAAEAHADLEASVRFQCANPGALKGVDMLLFKAFPRLRQLDVAVATGKTQRGARLTRQQTMLTF